MGVEAQRLERRGDGAERMDGGTDVMDETGPGELGGAGAAARVVRRLDHLHRPS